MNRIRALSIVLSFLCALASASPALAQGRFYAGGGVGQSDINEGVASGLIDSGTIDGKGTGYKIFGGYQFHPNFGLELAYVDLGKASYSGSFFGLPVVGGQVKVSGINFSAVGTLPFDSGFALFGKLGMFSWEAMASDRTGGLPFSARTTGTDLSGGIGLSYNVTKDVSVRAEWERFELSPGSASLLSVGLSVAF